MSINKMDYENVIHKYNGILFILKGNWCYESFRKMNGTGKRCIHSDDPDSEKQVLYILSLFSFVFIFQDRVSLCNLAA